MPEAPIIGMPSIDDKWVITPSGLVAPDSATRRAYDRWSEWLRSRPIAVSLFTGAGGFDLGMIQGGFHVVAALEWDPICVMTYLTNLGADHVEMHFPTDDDRERMYQCIMRVAKQQRKENRQRPQDQTQPDDPDRPIPPWLRSGSNRKDDWGPGCGHMWVGDARQVSGKEILDALGLKRGDVDCVFGGPPCQGFSTAGRRNVMDPRNSLVFEFARLVVEIHPKTMVFENAPNIVNMTTPEGIPVVDALCRILEDGDIGRFETLKRSLLANPTAGAVLKHKRVDRSRAKRKPAAQHDPVLFGGEEQS